MWILKSNLIGEIIDVNSDLIGLLLWVIDLSLQSMVKCLAILWLLILQLIEGDHNTWLGDSIGLQSGPVRSSFLMVLN